MVFNKIQQKIINDIVNFKPMGVETLFKELLENILNKNFKNFGIIIKKDSIYISSIEIINDKKKVYELFFLIEFLIKKHLFKFIKTGKNIEDYGKNYKYNIYSEENLIKISFNSSIIKLIYYNLYSDFYISSELKEIRDRGYKSVEEKNLKYTLIALWISIIISVVGFYVDWNIATKVNTVIEFAKPEQLQNASSTTTININNDNCKPN